MAGLASTLLVDLMVTGCAPGAACPASGWFNTVGIHLEGNLDDVAVVQMCAADGCAASAPLEQEPGKPFHASASGEPATVSSMPSAVTSLSSISRVDERNWRASVEMATPESVTVRVLTSTGQVLDEADFALEWRRVGRSDQCGGPGEAGPVNLEIPS